MKLNDKKGGNFFCFKFCGVMDDMWLNRIICGRYYFV